VFLKVSTVTSIFRGPTHLYRLLSSKDFVSLFVGAHVCRWGYSGGSAYAFLKISTIASIFHGLSDAFVQASIKQRLYFFICTS
jgi:hypothetical protein